MKHAQHPPARRIARAPSDAIQVRCCYWQFPACSLPAGGGSGPTGPVVTTTPNTAILTWDAVTDPSVTDPNLLGYRVYYGTAPGTYIQSFRNGLDVGNVPTTTLTGLTSGMTYYFAVTVVDTSTPQRESAYSNEVSAIIR